MRNKLLTPFFNGIAHAQFFTRMCTRKTGEAWVPRVQLRSAVAYFYSVIGAENGENKGHPGASSSSAHQQPHTQRLSSFVLFHVTALFARAIRNCKFSGIHLLCYVRATLNNTVGRMQSTLTAFHSNHASIPTVAREA